MLETVACLWFTAIAPQQGLEPFRADGSAMCQGKDRKDGALLGGGNRQVAPVLPGQPESAEQNQTAVFLALTDFSCRGRRFHGSFPGCFPLGSPEGA